MMPSRASPRPLRPGVWLNGQRALTAHALQLIFSLHAGPSPRLVRGVSGRGLDPRRVVADFDCHARTYCSPDDPLASANAGPKTSCHSSRKLGRVTPGGNFGQPRPSAIPPAFDDSPGARIEQPWRLSRVTTYPRPGRKPTVPSCRRLAIAPQVHPRQYLSCSVRPSAIARAPFLCPPRLGRP